MSRKQNKQQNRIEEPNQNNQQQNLSGDESSAPISEGTVVETPETASGDAADVVDALDLGEQGTIGDPAVE